MAAPPLKTDPKYGYFPWWPENGNDWVHPEDIATARAMIPSGRIYRRDGTSGPYVVLHYGEVRLRVKRTLWQEVEPEGFEIGDWVEVVAQASMVFVQAGELADIPKALEPFRNKPLDDLTVLLHLDLVHGLAHDEAALRYIVELDRADGIVTVHHHLVALARRLNLLSIVSLFLQDTRAVGRGIAVIEKSRPDAIELLPSVAATAVADRFAQIHTPRIAGGLIYNLNSVQQVLDSGCRAASTSNRALWKFNADPRSV